MDALKGMITALVTSFFIGLLFAYTFRLPIPLVGMMGPFGEVSTQSFGFFGVMVAVLAAWLVYGFLGGFIVVPFFGGVAGYFAGRAFQGSAKKNQIVIAFSAIASAVPVVLISTLDFIIGPW